mmetsp:Transcript_21460/g.36328  ORF Transcript_21460/g.36328 Transcript_21460/m.36328 type:complete len:271 (-) Transcript_21460:1819-2631(-)
MKFCRLLLLFCVLAPFASLNWAFRTSGFSCFRRTSILRMDGEGVSGEITDIEAFDSDSDSDSDSVASIAALSKEVRDGAPVVWTAAVKSTVKVKEIKRSVEDYMALPASQYSVLAAEQVIRLSDSDFKIVLGNLNFFGTKIVPILYVTVNVLPDEAKSEIIVTHAETTGSETAIAVNGTFSISAVNTVSAGVNKKGQKTLTSDTKLQIDATVPKSRFPLGVIKNGGNFVMQSSLNLIVPTFVRILARDFKRWSAGNDERAAVEGASLDLQ